MDGKRTREFETPSPKLKKQKLGQNTTNVISYVGSLEDRPKITKEQMPEPKKTTNGKSDLFTKLYFKIKHTPILTNDQKYLFITKLYGLFCRTVEDCAISVVQNVLQKNLSQEQHHEGLAGGKKFYTKGIFYKFPAFFEDEYITILYKDEERAMKTAKLELQAIDQLIGCSIESTVVPLAACIDVLGYRLLALSHVSLPDKKVLWMNSETWDEKLKNIVDKLRKCLRVSLPCDMDIYKLDEYQDYLFLDLHRMFPAESEFEYNDIVFDHIQEMRNVRRLNHVRRLRPELIKLKLSDHENPLSSDAFLVGNSTKKENNRIVQIVNWLRNEHIPNIARNIPISINTPQLLVEYLHTNGINLR